MKVRPVPVVVTAVALLTSLVGCSDAAERREAATEAARAFHAAVAQRNGARACAWLARETVAGLEKAVKLPCARAVLTQDVARLGKLREVRVAGDQAQVAFTGDTVFVGRYETGWKVVAAGCRPRNKGQSYECLIARG
ncbi:MAG TPA: hypothetical protein VIL34_12215 [Actinopolymorphaceae bacterium]|jgi:type II secretory pathway pseudopilin PulG